MKNWLALAALGLVACSEVVIEPQQPNATGAGGAGSTSSGPGSAAGGIDPQSCDETNAIELVLTLLPEGVADSQVIPVTFAGEDGYLAIDTGSPWTFVFGAPGGPEYVEHAGDVTIGCEIYPVPSLTFEGIGREPFNGKSILGIVGMDFFSEVPSEIDYPGRRVVRYLDDAMPRENLVEVPVDWNGERVVVDAMLDATPVRLIHDAGAAHTIWVGVDGHPGDEEVDLGTADGESTPAFEGTASLDFATDPQVNIPIFRVPEFPYLEEELEEIGAQGLLGATGFGFRRLVFDLDNQRILLGPRIQP